MEEREQRYFIVMPGHEQEAEAALFIGLTDSFYCLPVVIDSRLPKPDQMAVFYNVLLELEDKRVLLIPADFITDCHSTPPWSQSVLPAYDNHTNLAAVAHDRLYMNWEEFVATYPELKAIDGKQYADKVYLELMERFKPGSFRNKLYYAGVKLLGGWNWRKYRSQAKPP